MELALKNTISREDLLIGGRWRPARSGRYFETVDPSTERVIAHVAEAGAADIDAAVAAARVALNGEWGQMRAAERGRILLRLAELIRTNQDSLVELESLDSGKPVSAVRRQDLPAALDTLTYYAGWADKINGQLIPARPDGRPARRRRFFRTPEPRSTRRQAFPPQGPAPQSATR